MKRPNTPVGDETAMRDEYDFTAARPNPYVKKLKRPVTIRLDQDTVSYFRDMAQRLDVPYQSLINSYLTDAARKGKTLQWV
jgi:uncharacterized protein (DUF4415 family)